MGILSRMVGKRVAADDAARVQFFDLPAGEMPVEAHRVWVATGWPTKIGIGEPAYASIVSNYMGGLFRQQARDEGMDMRHLEGDNFPFASRLPLIIDSLVLLTTKSIRWKHLAAVRGKTDPTVVDLRPWPGLIQRGDRYTELGIPQKSVSAEKVWSVNVDHLGTSGGRHSGYVLRLELAPRSLWNAGDMPSAPRYDVLEVEAEVRRQYDFFSSDDNQVVHLHLPAGALYGGASSLVAGFDWLGVPINEETRELPRFEQEVSTWRPMFERLGLKGA